MKELKLQLKDTLPHEVAVGLGNIQVIEGTLYSQREKIKHVEVYDIAGLQINQSTECFLPRDENVNTTVHHAVDFAVALTWRTEHIEKTVELYLRVTYVCGASRSLPLKKFKLLRSIYKPLEITPRNQQQPFVVICMATYQPQSVTFRRQIESILLQTYENWHLIISDDASDSSSWHEIEAICSTDPARITLIRHKKNLGFYHNFERVLAYTPKNTDFVAFADQDDLWYPEKLQSLLGTLQSTGAQLAYSDMRVVGEAGNVIADTYWQGRKNEYRDFDTVYLANTVTGAASLFKFEMVDRLLPFPAKIGDAFHDHWLACMALATGKIAYANKPLYDYFQYGTSVIGHCDFTRWTMSQRVLSAFGLLKRMLNPVAFKQWLGQKLGGGIAIYRGECVRLRLMSDVILLRGDVEKPKLSTLNLLRGSPIYSAMKLLITHVRILVLGKTTDDAEFRLAMGCLSRAYEKKKL